AAHPPLVDDRLGRLLLARAAALCATLVHPATPPRTPGHLPHPLVRRCPRRVRAPLPDYGRRTPAGCRAAGPGVPRHRLRDPEYRRLAAGDRARDPLRGAGTARQARLVRPGAV